MLWSTATDIDEGRKAAAVVLRLGGTARQLAREVDLHTLTNGANIDTGDGNGPQPFSGLAVLLRGLSRKYAPLGAEVTIKAVTEFMMFRRLPHEDIDNALMRFDLLRMRANGEGFTMNALATSWYLLNALQVPHSQWPMLLSPLNGNLPQDDQQLNGLQSYLRRQGHLLETRSPYNVNNAHRQQGGLGVFWAEEE